MLKAKNTHGRECPALVRGAFPSVCPWPSVCWSKVSPGPPTRSRLRSCRLWRGKATPSGRSRLDPDWPYVLQRTVGFEADLVEFNKNGLSPTDLQQRSRGARGAEHCGAPVHGRPAPSETAPTRAPREALSTRGSGRTERTRTVGKGEGQSAGQKGTRSGRAGKRGRGRAGRGGTHLSSRFCPTHTRPPWRGVGLLQARCRTWKPMPQVVLQGDQVVQGVQPPFLRRQSGGGAESQGEETVPCGHPPAPPSAPRPRGPPAWGPRD